VSICCLEALAFGGGLGVPEVQASAKGLLQSLGLLDPRVEPRVGAVPGVKVLHGRLDQPSTPGLLMPALEQPRVRSGLVMRDQRPAVTSALGHDPVGLRHRLRVLASTFSANARFFWAASTSPSCW
jgi:hypothetical protein